MHSLQKAITPVVLAVLILSCPPAWAEKSPYDWAFTRLDYIRQEKIDHLKRLTHRLHTVAKNAPEDRIMSAFFDMNSRYFDTAQSAAPPESLTRDIRKMREEFNRYYISHYYVFYDILFVNNSGTVFYTIRKETDTYSDLAAEQDTIGRLGKIISGKPEKETFIDFYHYPPSSEPAAFFVEPVHRQGRLEGWIVFQCAINKFNSIFASTDDLGQTGETFLVNQEGLMLTESSFRGETTILRQHLDNNNITAKFRHRIGTRTVTDYRGETALSAFEVVEFLGTRWLVVAKIDKDEITTDHYRRYKRYYQNRLLDHLAGTAVSPAPEQPLNRKDRVTLRVDMDEFLKAADNELLETWGIKTCTAVIATKPGKFAYLAHISPLDEVYNGSGTNLLDQVTNKIKNFDIYPCEKRQVVFVTAAPHLDSLCAIIDRVIEEGFFLSQIQIAYHPSAGSLAVLSDYRTHFMAFEWDLSGPAGGRAVTYLDQTLNAGKIIEAIMSGD